MIKQTNINQYINEKRKKERKKERKIERKKERKKERKVYLGRRISTVGFVENRGRGRTVVSGASIFIII